MSMKEKFLKWVGQFAEETAAETVTEIAIDKFPPVFMMSLVCYGCLAAALVLGFVGWYFQHLVVLCYVLSGISAFVGAVLYLIRSYVVSKLSKILLAGYRQVKSAAQSKLGTPNNGVSTRDTDKGSGDNVDTAASNVMEQGKSPENSQ